MWSNVIGQDRVKEILTNTYQRRRIPHAYLFHGQEGTGKDAAAAEFAMLINCSDPIDGKDACGECKSCREIGMLKPPHIRFITALPTGKNESEDKDPLLTLDEEDAQAYLAELALKASDKYHKISIQGANDIRISSIRLLKEQVSLTGYAGKKRIFLISGADRMNQQSSNALLKILEEPPPDTVLILTTSRVNSLLPTITGRCSSIKFELLGDDEVRSYIVEKHPGIKPQEASFYAALSQGSITRCREIIAQDYLELREKVLDFLLSVLKKKYISLGREIDFVVSAKSKDRTKRFLALLAMWFRDVQAVDSGAEALAVNSDKIERLRRFSENYRSDNYRIIKLIEEAMADVDRNIFQELLLTNLSIQISACVEKRNSGTE